MNATFYRLQKPETVARWVEVTPPDFVFAIKASRYLTHIKRLANLSAGIERLMETLEPLTSSPKMGPMLWQLPESFHRDDDRLREAIEALPPGRHCFEFRHPSWFAPEVYEILRRHGTALVIGDHPKWPFQARELTADWTYVRLHHGKRGRRGNYSERELETWGRRIRVWRRRAEVFVYFNNDWEAFAFRNATWLRDRLDAGRL